MAITPLMPVYPRSPVRPVRGEGVYLFGEQGERYLDFAAGIAVNLLGHGHPHLTQAIQGQARIVRGARSRQLAWSAARTEIWQPRHASLTTEQALKEMQ